MASLLVTAKLVDNSYHIQIISEIVYFKISGSKSKFFNSFTDLRIKFFSINKKIEIAVKQRLLKYWYTSGYATTHVVVPGH